MLNSFASLSLCCCISKLDFSQIDILFVETHFLMAIFFDCHLDFHTMKEIFCLLFHLALAHISVSLIVLRYSFCFLLIYSNTFLKISKKRIIFSNFRIIFKTFLRIEKEIYRNKSVNILIVTFLLQKKNFC